MTYVIRKHITEGKILLTADMFDSKRVSTLLGARTNKRFSSIQLPRDSDALVSTNVGRAIRIPECLSLNTPTFASTSTVPVRSGRVIIM